MRSPAKFGVLLLACALSACSTTGPRTTYAHKPGTSEQLKLIVWGSGCDVSDGDASGPLPRASVSLICANGSEVHVGTTDAFGEIRIPKKALRDCSAKVILLSAKHFFDGAIRADNPSLDLLAYDELHVRLAVSAMF